MKPIYKPSGRAGEYGDYAINIYTGCPHRCYYCFAPSVLHRDREEFHSHVEPRPGIIEAVKQQLDADQITGKLIHLCFTCDPYPKGYNSTTTRAIIQIIKHYGNHVQILTKNGGDAEQDFDLLDENDWFGITYAGYTSTSTAPPEEPNSGLPVLRLNALRRAHNMHINTWVSCEPVLHSKSILHMIMYADYIDKFKIGKLNYHPSDINWRDFGHEAERLCKDYGRNYYIKEDLQREMELARR